MKQLTAIIKKEFFLVIRDIPGLIILFLMPVILIFAVTGTQENAFKTLYDNKSEILFVDYDNQYLGKTIEDGLMKSGYFHVIKKIGEIPLDSTSAIKAISAGDFQVGIVVKANATHYARARAYKNIHNSFDNNSSNANSEIEKKPNAIVDVYFDPATRDSYKNAVLSSLQRLIQSVETRIILNTLFEALPQELNQQLQLPIRNYLLGQLDEMELIFTEEIKKRFGENLPQDFKIEAQPRDVKFDISEDIRKGIKYKDNIENENLIVINKKNAQSDDAVIKPTLIQNNVPAFALFAMFFIVIPLAGSLLSERNEGTYNRIRTIPVKYITILWGKIVVYASICIIQLSLMIIAGMYFLPAIYGMPPLEVGNNYFTLTVATFASAFSAIGFGLLVGNFSSTQSQAGMFGSFMVVILGILGGIFLPVYMMPEPLQALSIISPIRWGIDSFLDIFVRNADIHTIGINLLRMTGFFILALFLSMITFIRRK